MVDSGPMQNPDDLGVVIGLDRVQHATRKPREKCVDRLQVCIGVDAVNGLVRLPAPQHVPGALELAANKLHQLMVQALWIVGPYPVMLGA